MEDGKGQFISAVNEVLKKFESARRDPRFVDEASHAYRLSEDQKEDLRQFLLLNGKGRASLQTSGFSEVRDLVVLFSILGLMGPKGKVIAVFSHIGILSQLYSKTALTWYQLMGLRVGAALGPDEEATDLPSVDVIFTTSELLESNEQVARLAAAAEVHAWEGSAVTWDAWEVTQSETKRRWWEFWK